MPLDAIIRAGRKIYESAKDMEEEPLIPSLGKRNSMPTTSTRVSAREAAAKVPAPVKPAPKTKANPMDMGRGMGGMLGGAVKAVNQRKKMLDNY